MAESATKSIVVGAPVEQVWAELMDVPSYPQWVSEVKAARVLHSVEDGSPGAAWFRLGALGQTVEYVIGYDYAPDVYEVTWSLLEAESIRSLDGSYLLSETNNGTEVVYTLALELNFTIPTLMRRQGEARLMDGALKSLKRRIERQR